MHVVAHQHLNRLQFDASGLVPRGKDNLEKAIYFLSDFALDDFGRFFPAV
jgi:hypothetical protein